MGGKGVNLMRRDKPCQGMYIFESLIERNISEAEVMVEGGRKGMCVEVRWKERVMCRGKVEGKGCV